MVESREPKEATEYIKGGLAIRFSFGTIVREEQQFYTYEEVIVDKLPSYDKIVSSIIRERYTIDEELALINNHLLGSTPSEAVEYQNFQDWRALAKAVGKVVVYGKETLDKEEIGIYNRTMSTDEA